METILIVFYIKIYLDMIFIHDSKMLFCVTTNQKPYQNRHIENFQRQTECMN